MNNLPNLMFHEILDDFKIKSGWNLESISKYTITKKKFDWIINKFGNSVNYTFDDGGKSNLYASEQIKKKNIKGIFFISTDFIGCNGFLNLEEIKYMSKSHHIFSHGHKHLMTCFNRNDLKNDWNNSIQTIKNFNFRSDVVCLPGGTFSRNHYSIFKDLGIKYVYHSAPINIFLLFLYGKDIRFLPRLVVDENFTNLSKFTFSGLKSIIKQLINFLK